MLQGQEGSSPQAGYRGARCHWRVHRHEHNYVDYNKGFRREHTIGSEKGSGTETSECPICMACLAKADSASSLQLPMILKSLWQGTGHYHIKDLRFLQPFMHLY